LLFRNRRRAELISVILMILISVSGTLPGLFSISDSRGKRPPGKGHAVTRPAHPESWGQEPAGSGGAHPAWVLAFPPEMYVRSLRLGVEGRSRAGLLPLALLAAVAAGIHGVAWKIYGRLLDTPEVGAGPRREEKSRLRRIRAPGLSPAASAVALVQARMVLRT